MFVLFYLALLFVHSIFGMQVVPSNQSMPGPSIVTDLSVFDRFLACSKKEWEQEAKKYEELRQGKTVKVLTDTKYHFPVVVHQLAQAKLADNKTLLEGMRQLRVNALWYPPSTYEYARQLFLQGYENDGLKWMHRATEPWQVSDKESYLHLPAVRALSKWLYGKKNFEDALEVATRGAEINDQECQLLANTIECKLGRDPAPIDDLALARSYIQDALQEKRNSRFCNLDAQIQCGLSHLKGAKESNQQQGKELLCKAGCYYLSRGLRGKANECFEQCLEVPEAAWHYANYRLLKIDENNTTEKIKVLNILYKALPRDPVLIYKIVHELKKTPKCELEYMGSQGEQMVHFADQALAQGSYWAAKLMYDIHCSVEGKKEKEKSLLTWLKKDTSVLNKLKLAHYYFLRGKTGEAQNCLINLDSAQFPQVYYIEGLIREQKKSMDRACQSFFNYLSFFEKYVEFDSKGFIFNRLLSDHSTAEVYYTMQDIFTRLTRSRSIYAPIVLTQLSAKVHKRQNNAYSLKVYKKNLRNFILDFKGKKIEQHSKYVDGLVKFIIETDDADLLWQFIEQVENNEAVYACLAQITQGQLEKIIQKTKNEKSIYFSLDEKEKLIKVLPRVKEKAWFEIQFEQFMKDLSPKERENLNGSAMSIIDIVNHYHKMGKQTKAIKILEEAVLKFESVECLHRLMKIDSQKNTQYLNKLDQQNNKAALYVLCQRYRYGCDNVNQDFSKAKEYLDRICKLDSETKKEYGPLYYEAGNYEKAYNLLKGNTPKSVYGLCCLAEMCGSGKITGIPDRAFLEYAEVVLSCRPHWDVRVVNFLPKIIKILKRRPCSEQSGLVNFLIGSFFKKLDQCGPQEDWQPYMQKVVTCANSQPIVKAKASLLLADRCWTETSVKMNNCDPVDLFAQCIEYLCTAAGEISKITDKEDQSKVITEFSKLYRACERSYVTITQDKQVPKEKIGKIMGNWLKLKHAVEEGNIKQNEAYFKEMLQFCLGMQPLEL